MWFMIISMICGLVATIAPSVTPNYEYVRMICLIVYSVVTLLGGLLEAIKIYFFTEEEEYEL